MKEWFYNEFKQVGINFESEDEVAVYDEKFKKTRNLDNEAAYIAGALKLKPKDTVLEIGTGTGELAIRLALLCKKVIAADVSETMLSYARKKTESQGINNIEFIHSGFLNINLEPESVDAVVSQVALHHLPDFWKSVAILNVSKMLKKDGRFLLIDSVFNFDIIKYEEAIDNQMQQLQELIGERIVHEFVVNIRDEYPTYSWVIEKMLEKTGFEIENIVRHNVLMSSFLCFKK